MSTEHKRKIDWLKTFAHFALAVWGMASFLAAMAGVAWLSVRLGGQSPFAAAVVAMGYATVLNWLVFLFIERQSSKP